MGALNQSSYFDQETFDKLHQCLQDSFVGSNTVPPTDLEIWHFYYTLSQGYKYMFFFHMALGVAIIAFVIYRCARKDPLTKFQLACLTSLSLGNLFNCIDEYLVAVDLKFNCSFANYAMLGCEYLFLFNVNFVISYKFYCFSKDLMEFALHQHLPSERTKKIKEVLYITIWVFTVSYFCFYIIFSGILYS